MSKNNFRPEYIAHLPKTDHDLSQRFVFTSSVGHILPVYHHLLNPGEHVYMDMDLFTRTQPLVTAAFLDVDEDIDVFFVPMPMILTAFEAACYQTNDFLSSFFDGFVGQNHSNFPLLSMEAIPENPDPLYPYQYLQNERDNGEVFAPMSAFRLWNHLGYNPNIWTKYNEGSSPLYGYGNPNVFPYALLAYHAIYYKSGFFMMEDRESQVLGNYNWDKWFGRDIVKWRDLPTNFFKLHYVPYDGADYFQATKPTPMISDSNMLNHSFDSTIKDAMRLFIGDSDYIVTGSPDGEGDVRFNSTAEVIFNNSSTNQLRAGFAFEKYLRVLGRANKNYDAQILAHFGVKVPHDVKHQLTHIGHFHSEIHIGEVISTAQTTSPDASTGASLGDIAGKGYGKNDTKKVVDFQAPVHGVIMAVYYARPKRIYDLYGFDKINSFRGIQDLWNPEFDALGVQPLFKYEFVPDAVAGSASANIVGWQYRFQERKQKYDRTTYAFLDPTVYTDGTFNAWQSWINGQKPLKFDTYQTFQLKNFLVQPSDLDNLFNVSFVKDNTTGSEWETKPWLLFQGDPFLHDLHIRCKLISPMSKTGEPKLDF